MFLTKNLSRGTNQKKRHLLVIAAIAFALSFTLSVGQVPTAKADFISCAAGGGNLIDDCLNEDEGTLTSFIEFEGGLTAPTAEGYDESLTQADNARDYVLQVTNFVLGFLGLAAIIIIIYGGVLYLTAAGAEEQATKGKKSISYAIIGILIILGSYAIVNTVIMAPSGTESDLSGAAPGQGPAGSAEDQQAARRALFNYAASEVNSVAKDFATAYQNFTEVNNDIVELSNVPNVETSGALSQLITSKKRIVQNIQKKAGTFSQVNEKSQAILNILDKYDQMSKAKLQEVAGDEVEWYEKWWGDDGSSDFQNELNDKINSQGLQLGNNSDFAYAISELNIRLKELKGRIEENVDLDNVGVSTAFDAIINELQKFYSAIGEAQTAWLIKVAHAANTYTLNAAPTNADVLHILQLLSALQTAVQDIQFVYTIISVDADEGNAPFYVNFDGLKSLDPDNVTIPDANYKWNYGDNNPVTATNPNTATGAAVHHIFFEPGTFVVKLEVESPTDGVAKGLGYKRITVKPPIHKIYLTANTKSGNESWELRSYDENGVLIVDKNILKLTPDEAANGIIFDATKTDDEQVSSVRWNFGDNSQEIVQSGGSLDLKHEHAFTEPGTYTTVIEITDKQGNKDRKIVHVVVDTPLARYNIAPGNRLKVNQEFTIDAGSSSSEGGQITNWNFVPDQNGSEIEVDNSISKELFKAKFTEPGQKTISLSVEDNLGGEDAEDIKFVIESEPPSAQYTYEVPEQTQPATIEFNGSKSYDPDGEAKLKYKWEVDGQTSASNFAFVENTTFESERPKIKFLEKGTYSVSLTAIDPDGYGTGVEQESSPYEQDIVVSNILDIAWNKGDSTTSQIAVDATTGQAKGNIVLTLLSEEAIAYEVDWGDGEKETGSITNSVALEHDYLTAGSFVVKANVFDEEDNENKTSRKVFIGSSDTPVGVISLDVNSIPVIDTTNTIEIGRKDTVKFSADKSMNVDGTGRKLNYSWDFGNGQKSTQEKSSQQYKEIGDYIVKLKVTNANDVSQSSTEDTLNIKVIGQSPTLKSITAVPSSTELVTPVSVVVTAVGAEDADGKISKYRWWYYDPNNDSDELGVQVTTSPSATIIIGTRGLEDEEKTYKFAVELTDDENNSASSRSIIPENNAGSLTVTNGPNKAPVASFTVNRTSIMAGESVNFSSSSIDPDGRIVSYYWDFEGDGFADNTENLGSNLSHVFNEGAPDGIKVRLKVKDNNESENVSDGVMIFVDSAAKDPVAAFVSAQQVESKKVVFTNNSEADTANKLTISSWKWDFDIATDSDGDGNKDNDSDSTVKNPTYEYPDYGIYRAKLTVVDSDEVSSFVKNFVNVKTPKVEDPLIVPTTTETSSTEPKTKLEARLLTTPAPNVNDGKVHLEGDTASITIDFSTSLGEITHYYIDANLQYDTDGNGFPNDDKDHTATKPGKWTTELSSSYGNIKIRLTVKDKDGKTDSVDKDIIFDSEEAPTHSLGANMFGPNTNEILALLVSIWGFGILLLTFKRLKKEK